MSVVFFMSMLALLLLAEVEDDEDELERFLGSTRHSSRVTFASGRDGARDASRISVNFDVVMAVCRVSYGRRCTSEKNGSAYSEIETR